MHPVLFSLGSFSLHSYGLLIAIGVILAQLLAMREGDRQGLDGKMIGDFIIWILLGSFLGARVLHLIVNFDHYWANFDQGFFYGLVEMVAIWKGGIVYYGGFITALVIMIFLCRYYENKKNNMASNKIGEIDFGAKNQKLNYLRLGDILIPSVAFAHIFGRLGCFAAGCCYGAHSDVSWAVSFPEGGLAHTGLIHPSQLYSAFGNIIIFIALLMIRPKKKFHGQIFLSYLILYPIHRSIVETFRGDTERGFVIEGILSTSQFISIFIVLFGLSLTLIALKKIKKQQTNDRFSKTV